MILCQFLLLSASAWARYLKRFARTLGNSGLTWAKAVGPVSPKPKADARPASRILIATSVGGHLTALNFEAVVAASLVRRGAQVDALLCDAALPACMEAEHRYYPTPSRRRSLVKHGPRELCISCTRVGRSVYDDLGVPVLLYRDFLDAEDVAVVERILAATDDASIRGFRLDDLPVGEHAYAGALRFFARGDIGEESHADEITRSYFRAALTSVMMMRRLLRTNRYDACVLNHGIYVPQGLLAEVCRAEGVRVVTWNPAYRKSCFILSHDTTYHHTLMSEPTESWERMRWTDEIEAGLMRYLASRMEGTQDWIWFHDKPTFDVASIAAELGLDLAKPTIGMLTNVVWDAQLHYPANAFGGMIEWIIETIAWFAQHPELQLVVRIHPAEIRGTLPSRQRVLDEIGRVFPTLPGNIFVIPPDSNASTYTIMAQCNAVIIYGTKTGVELTSIGTPVIVAGEAWIRGKGVTTDCSSKGEYFDALESLPFANRMAIDTMKRARRYAYHFFFRRMIPVPFMQPRKGWPSIVPVLRDASELAPGVHRGLDVICNGILTGSAFVYEAENLGEPA